MDSHATRRVPHSRALYRQLWRIWTLYDWRQANRESRNRHKAARRESDSRRYLAKRMAQLEAARQKRLDWLQAHGLGD